MIEELFLEEITRWKHLVLGFDENGKCIAWEVVQIPTEASEVLENTSRLKEFKPCTTVKVYKIEKVAEKRTGE